MKVLFLTSSEEDYLADGLLLGLRQIFGAELVDYPRRDILYRNCPDSMRSQVRGQGFTLYTGLLEEMDIDRYAIGAKLKRGEFDLIIISDIWRQFGFFAQWRPYLSAANTVLIDGSDTPQVYPHAGHWWRHIGFWFLPKATAGFLYFKREMTHQSRFNLWHKLLPAFSLRFIPHYRGLRRISFGMPFEKIVTQRPCKTKDFPRHIVDVEIASAVPGSSSAYAFTSEAEYYADLQASRFGITMRRAGWDCLRHYEIAANGTVPCFRDLILKPATCAPHGLVVGKNCLSYNGTDDLLRQVSALTENEYFALQQGALEWIRSKSTRVIAEEVLAEWEHIRTDGKLRQAPARVAIPGDGEVSARLGVFNETK